MVTLNFQHGTKVIQIVNVTWLFLPHQDRHQFWAHQLKKQFSLCVFEKIDSPKARLKLGMNSENRR